MVRNTWKTFVMAGLLGLAGLAVGCEEREVGEDVENYGVEADEGMREGVGGGGVIEDDAEIGDQEGVINDGEGPFEQNELGGQDTILEEGEGPLEENTER